MLESIAPCFRQTSLLQAHHQPLVEIPMEPAMRPSVTTEIPSSKPSFQKTLEELWKIEETSGRKRQNKQSPSKKESFRIFQTEWTKIAPPLHDPMSDKDWLRGHNFGQDKD